MRLRISHSTTYEYDPPATGVIQVLRMTPGNHDGQYVANWQVDVSVDARLDMRHDAFGNITHVFSHGPLADLTVHVAGQIDTQDTGGILRGAVERFPPSLFLRATSLTEADGAMQKMARQMFEEIRGQPARLPARAAAAAQRVHGVRHRSDQLRHVGDRSVQVEARRLPGLRAHLHRLGPLGRRARALRLRPLLPQRRRRAQEAGHAWVEAFVPDLGWVGFDPANGISTTDAHARVAIGLDYLGAAPVRGTRYGGGTETLSVAVRVDQAGRQSQS